MGARTRAFLDFIVVTRGYRTPAAVPLGVDEDPDDQKDTPTPEGPEKDPRSADSPAREEGKQNPLVHAGADADDRGDTNEGADARVRIEQPDGRRVPEAEH